MNAYKIIKVNDKPMSEHRYVMEQYLERKLLFAEIVHHKNLIKNDNRIENLIIMTRKEHTTLHNKLPKYKKPFVYSKMDMFITVKDVMLKYNVEKYFVYKWIKKGMPCLRIGHLRRFKEMEIEKWMNEQ